MTKRKPLLRHAIYLNVLLILFSYKPDKAVQAAPLGGELDKEYTTSNSREGLINFDFQDVPVRNVLQLLASYSDFNIVVSDQVAGSLSIRLQNIGWQKALDIILQMKSLVKRVEGNVILITTVAEYEQSLIEPSQKSPQLLSKTFKLEHIDSLQVINLIRGKEIGPILSKHGSIAALPNTSSVIVTDSSDRIDAVNELLALIDVEKKQVQIEARIVSIKEGYLDELGVKWRYTSPSQIEHSRTLDVSSTSTSGIDHLFNVNLPASNVGAATLAFQVAKFGSGALLDLELSALQRESKAEIISSPRLITTDLTPAYIEQGTEIPYSESSSSGATSVSFKKAVLSLTVTPKIMPTHRILLDIDVTQDHPGDVVQTGTGEAVAVDTQKIGTQVLVNDGATVVLGGIHQNSVTEITEKVPVLGDLPLLGALFRRKYEQKTRSELIIFVTPKVLSVER